MAIRFPDAEDKPYEFSTINIMKICTPGRKAKRKDRKGKMEKLSDSALCFSKHSKSFTDIITG
jgi:hypothetical protein